MSGLIAPGRFLVRFSIAREPPAFGADSEGGSAMVPGGSGCAYRAVPGGTAAFSEAVVPGYPLPRRGTGYRPEGSPSAYSQSESSATTPNPYCIGRCD